MSAYPVVPARFVTRPNRFVVEADLDDGRRVAAHLPNTGRLEHLLEPDRPLILRRDGAHPRATEYTVTRAWDGSWVGLEASRAPRLLETWLRAGNPFAGVQDVVDIHREVTVEGHRLDLMLDTGRGRVWVEVKSGGRASDGKALLSKTPSTRGVAHLAALGRLAEGGTSVAAFVIQRSDVSALRVGGDADRGWIGAVRRAHRTGVAIVAFGCDVTESEVCIARALPVVWDD